MTGRISRIGVPGLAAAAPAGALCQLKGPNTPPPPKTSVLVQ